MLTSVKLSGVPSSRANVLRSRSVCDAVKTSGRDDLRQQAVELVVGEGDAVESLELLAEVALEGGAVADVVAVGVFEVTQSPDELLFKLALGGVHRVAQPRCNGRRIGGQNWPFL